MPYSYSQYGVHKQCGARYKYRYIDRLPEKKHVSASRGTSIHDAVEQYLKKTVEELPPEVHFYTDWLNNLREVPGIEPEKKVSLKQDWTPTTWDDPESYLRAVIDLYVPPNGDTLEIFEFKTGKEYEDHVHQRCMYGMLGLLIHPEIERVNVHGVYLDLKESRMNTYVQDMLVEYKGMWRRRFETLAEPLTHIPTPSYSCKYCSFSKDSGGPCPF